MTKLFPLLLLAACGGGSTSGSSTDNAFFLPTGNVNAPRVIVDAGGTMHVAYPALFGGGAFYAECAAGCADHDDVKVVAFDTGHDTVDNALLALDAAGHPRMLMVTPNDLIYASCDTGCANESNWKMSTILHHAGERDVTGDMFALDSQGRPRFLAHAPLAYFGVGQKPWQSEWASCDANCTDAAAWTFSKLGDQVFAYGSLKFDSHDRAHLALVANDDHIFNVAAYETCAGDCGNPSSWSVTSFGQAFNSEVDAVTIHPRVELALTAAGKPRLAVMLKDGDDRKLAYFACDADNCGADQVWTGTVLARGANLGEGYALALDGNDHPRVAATLDYNIALDACDAADCTADGAGWKAQTVEGGNDIPTDEIFLYPNCSVGAWLLHSPSLAVLPDGHARLTYNARDVSGGGIYATDPTGPACTAGTDMVLARTASL